MVSNAVAQKYWGKEARERYRRYLQSDAWKHSGKPFYKPQDSDADGVVHPQQKYTTRPTNAFTKNDCPI